MPHRTRIRIVPLDFTAPRLPVFWQAVCIDCGPITHARCNLDTAQADAGRHTAAHAVRETPC